MERNFIDQRQTEENTMGVTSHNEERRKTFYSSNIVGEIRDFYRN
jgi:hypothetical protein